MTKKLCANYTVSMKRPALFLDRDGVVIKDSGYVNSFDRLEILPSISGAIKLAKKHNFFVFIVTNQAGIARKYFTELEAVKFNQQLLNKLAEIGAYVDELVYCPSHPNFGEKVICACRKPRTGMLEYLSGKWPIDLENSLLIGDKDSDILAGQNMQITSKK